MKIVPRTLAAGLLLGALALPGTASAQVAACADPYEDPSDSVQLQPGTGVQRGFCDADAEGGRDVDFFSVRTLEGHRYRIELVERGSGFDAARLHIEDAYDRSGAVTLSSETAHSLVTGGIRGEQLSFTAEALRSDATYVPVTGQDLGYTILVTDLGPAAATRVTALQMTPSTVRGGATATATITLDGVAPAGGTTVTLTSGDRSVQPPSTVTIPAGADQVTAVLTTTRVRRDTSVAVTATSGTSSTSTVLLVRR